VIYFVKHVSEPLVKIGTTTCLTMRLVQLARDVGKSPTVLGICAGSYADEVAIHQRFSHLREVGEWFRPDPELLAFVKAELQPWDGVDETPQLDRQRMYFDVDDRLRWALRLMAADRNAPSVAQLVLNVMQEQVRKYLSEVDRRIARGEDPSQAKSPRGRKPRPAAD
jgi:T5orf172 domain